MHFIDENLKDRLERNRAVRDEFIVPLYLRLLNANFARAPRPGDLVERTEEETAETRERIACAATTISNEQIAALLSDEGWRERLVAAWLVGLSKRVVFTEPIAKLLLASEQPYCGQGYCVALGLIGNDRCGQHLREYLSRYLPLNGRFYDQGWAVGALAHVERNPPEDFLCPEQWAEGNGHALMNPSDAIQRFSALVEYLHQHRMMSLL